MAATGALVLGGIATASSINSAQDAKKDRKLLRSQAENAEAERKAAETKGIHDAYAQTQLRKQALRSNSLFTGGAPAGHSSGRQTLGV
jgi:hypothetical protein